MPLFLWKKSYEIGLTEIDTQHRNLVGIINELSDAMMNQKGYTVVPHILEKLVDYIQFHFTTEEEIMRDTKYPALEMTTKVIGFKRACAKNHEINVVEVLNFLRDWLKEHIVMSDKKLKANIQTMDA